MRAQSKDNKRNVFSSSTISCSPLPLSSVFAAIPIYLSRPGFLHPKTGLPQGATLIVAPSKEKAGKWLGRLASCAGLSVLGYVMPLRERRQLNARQAAAFDVVVTTYDVR